MFNVNVLNIFIYLNSRHPFHRNLKFERHIKKLFDMLFQYLQQMFSRNKISTRYLQI